MGFFSNILNKLGIGQGGDVPVPPSPTVTAPTGRTWT